MADLARRHARSPRRRKLEGARIQNRLDALQSRLAPELLVALELGRVSDQPTANGPSIDEHLSKESVVRRADPQIGAKRIADWTQ
jgi:hypothetical protein